MSSQASHSRDRFATTRWSMVMQLASTDAPVARGALEELAQRYCYPLYAYVRRSGHSPRRAAEIARTLLRQLRDDSAAGAVRNVPGHYRRFLLDRIHAFLAVDHNEPPEDDVSEYGLPAPAELEAHYQRDGYGTQGPDEVFQRAFALEVLRRSLRHLRSEAHQTGHGDMYRELEPYLVRDPPAGEFESIGTRLACRPLALVLALKRLRQRLRELAAEELADTVGSADELMHEQDALLATLGKQTP